MVDPVKYYWEIEQFGIVQPLSEWALSVNFSQNLDFSNPYVKDLCKLWRKLQGTLSLGQWPLAFFIEHSKFQEAAKNLEFQLWREKNMTASNVWKRSRYVSCRTDLSCHG